MKLFLILFYILLVLGVIFVERKNTSEAIFWVVILLCLPYIGIFIYFIFGSTIGIKITAANRTKRLKECYQRLRIDLPQKRKCDISEEDSQVISFNQVYNNSPLTYYERADIFTNGKDHYRSLFEDIKNARKSIHVEFYTIHHDVVGQKFVQLLTEKAKEGVEVIVMCDFIANISTPRKMFQPLIKAGGRIKRLKPYLTHFRSHRKIVAIDGETAYIGGMNIGKQYANMAKVKNPWRDTQIRIQGQCAQVLESYFMSDWFCAVREKELEEAGKIADRIFLEEDLGGDHPCQFVMGGVDTEKEAVKMCYLSMMRSARKSIRIQTPYFIPDESTLDALKTAAASGVHVELMIPGIKASFFLDPVTNYYCGQLLAYGAQVHKYKGYIHAKTMVIDEELCCIGSVNMDMRSLMVDDEICGVFYENKLVRKYNCIYDNDIQNCVGYTKEDFDSRSRKEKLRESFFLLFAPLM